VSPALATTRLLAGVHAVLSQMGVEAYLVGGSVRDALLGREARDLDLAIAADPAVVGQEVARHLGGTFFPLSEDVGRVVLPEGAAVDLERLRGGIEEDLRRRDYTVDAMAVPLPEAARGELRVLDPLGGQEDLRRGIIRLVSPAALEEDPIRLLRGPRLATELGFELERETAAEIGRRASLLALAAAADPRIRQQVVALGSFGGYYDVRELIVAVATDTLLVDGQRQPWQPDPWAKEVLKSSLLYFVPDRRERDLLAAALDTGGRLPSAALSPTASLVQAVLLERDPQRAHQLLAQAPPELARTLDLLSPRTYTAQVQTEVFIVADRHDPLVPYTESVRLRHDLMAQGKPTRYAEIAIFRHVNPRLETNPASFLADFLRLFLQTYALLERLR